MSTADADFLERLRSLSLTAAQDLLTGLDRLKQLREEVSAVDPEEAQNNKARTGDLIYNLAKMELEHAEGLLKLGNTQAGMLFEHVRSLARVARNKGEPPLKVLEFRFPVLDPGANGPSQTLQFAIHNPFNVDADVRFELSKFRDQAGNDVPALAAAFRIEPSPSSVPARTNGNVVLTATPSAAQSQQEAVYFAELSVYLCAEIEQLAARRILKLKISSNDSGV